MNATDTLFDRRLAPALPMDQASLQEPLGVPVSRAFRVIRRRGWVAALVVVVVMGAATTIVMQLEPAYTSQASVLVESRRTQLNDLQVSAPEAQDTPNAVQTQIDILRSPALLLQVAKGLNLTEREEFDPPATGPIARLRALIGPAPVPPTQAERELTAAQILAGKLTITSELRSSVVRLSVSTGDAELSAAIVNEIAERYLAFNRDRKYATLQRAVSWFQTRLTELSGQVQESQAALQAYREANNLADTPITSSPLAADRLSVQAQQLADVNRQLTTVVGERARREAQVAEIADRLRRQGRPASGPDLPANLLGELNAIRAQEATLRQAVAQARRGVAEENAATSQMAGLLAQAQTARAMYDSFLGRATQLANAEGIQASDAELLSAGTVANGPSSPQRARLLAVAFAFSLLLGLGLALLSDRMRNRLGNLGDVEAKLHARPLAVAPRLRASHVRTAGNILLNPDFRDAMQRVLGAVTLLRRHGQKKVIAITSALPQEGKSVLAMGLAESAARSGLKVLLIDADLRRPTLVKRLKLGARQGLAEVLRGDARLDEAVERLPSGLYLLPSLRAEGGSQQLLASPRLGNLLRAARNDFDLIVVDTPPVLPMVDALLTAQHADAVIMATRWEHTPAPLAQEAIAMIEGSGAELAGVVLTRARLRTYANSTSEGAAHVHKHFRRYYRSAA